MSFLLDLPQNLATFRRHRIVLRLGVRRRFSRPQAVPFVGLSLVLGAERPEVCAWDSPGPLLVHTAGGTSQAEATFERVHACRASGRVHACRASGRAGAAVPPVEARLRAPAC